MFERLCKIQVVKELTVGLRGRKEELATPEKSALALASGGVDVFSTPMMILMMENTCDFSVRPYLSPGMATVGIRVDISHTSATPTGRRVWCESELLEIDGRRLVFAVKAYDEAGVIGEGRHERFIVDPERLLGKANAKYGGR